MAKKKETNPNQVLISMHPDIPFDDRTLDEPLEKKASSGPDYSAQLAELQANLKRLEDANTNLQRTNMALMGQSLTPQQPQFGPTEVNLEGLPDPVTNPKEYAEAIVTRGDAVLRARAAAQNWENQQNQNVQQRLDNIWTQFGKEHTAYADKTDLVEAAATKAVAAAKAQGLDPNKYMFAATQQFFADTVKILEGWGIKEEEKEEEVEDQHPLRTSGIPGGLESSGKLTTAADPDDAKIPSLMDELREWKQKTGFYA